MSGGYEFGWFDDKFRRVAAALGRISIELAIPGASAGESGLPTGASGSDRARHARRRLGCRGRIPAQHERGESLCRRDGAVGRSLLLPDAAAGRASLLGRVFRPHEGAEKSCRSQASHSSNCGTVLSTIPLRSSTETEKEHPFNKPNQKGCGAECGTVGLRGTSVRRWTSEADRNEA